MVIYLPNESSSKLVFFDTEFTERQELVQASFIILEKVNKDYFFLTTSLNIFINTRVTPEFETYTGIKEGFLGNEVVSKEEAKRVVSSFITENNINSPSSLVIGHGLNQDLIVLESIGCYLERCSRYDTLPNARAILGRNNRLKLSDLLLDAGYYQGIAHDAYQDARNLIPVYAFLKRIDRET